MDFRGVLLGSVAGARCRGRPESWLRGGTGALPQGRAARTAAAVVAAVATTAGAHLLGTGVPPPLAGLLLAVVVLTGPGWWLTRDERGWERLTAAQLGAQLGGHALFVATADDPAAHAGHGALGPELVLVIHVVGAAVAGAWLRCGERRAIAAARRALVVLRRLASTLLRTWHRTATAPTLPPAERGARRFVGAWLQHSIVHRGPPAVGC